MQANSKAPYLYYQIVLSVINNVFFFSLTYLKLNVEQINDVEVFLKLLHTK